MKFSSKYIYPTGLALLALLVFMYVFNAKIDFNGDNCYYYIFASSMAAGNGYVDIWGSPSALFPPGYPLLITPLRFFTDSVVAQKILNLLFLFAGVMLFYAAQLREKMSRALAFVVCAAVLVTPHILEFSTMMMSEPSCILFIILTIYAYTRLPEGGAVWRSPWLYVMLFAAAYAFYIRTQAVVLVGAVVLACLVAKRFKVAAVVAVTSPLAYLPWVLRNIFLGVGQSRYMSQIDFSNVWGNLKMLVVQAIPESTIPFWDVNYAMAPTKFLVGLSLVTLAVVVYGLWQLNRLRVLLIAFVVGNFAIISIMNTPSQYRYLVIVLPVITLGFLMGLWHLCNKLSLRLVKRAFSPFILLLLFVPAICAKENTMKHSVAGLHYLACSVYPPHVNNYLNLGDALAKKSAGATVAARKPELLYVKSGLKALRLREDVDDVGILNYMVDKKVDYLLLENLGFKFTYERLHPLVERYDPFFEMEMYTQEPVNVLFKFNSSLAERWLRYKGYR